MVSDVLFEAIEELNNYQEEQPEMYNEFKNEIDDIKEKMNSLLIKLDTPLID